MANVTGVIDFGVLRLFGTASSNGTPPANIQASDFATISAGDTLFFSSPTLATGSAVSFQLTATLHDLFTFTATDPIVASNSCATQDQDVISFISTAGQLGDSACAKIGTQSVTRIFAGTVGGSVPISTSLAISGRTNTSYQVSGVTYNSPTDTMVIDASNTATLTVQILTPGVTLSSASGATYLTPSPVPEAGSLSLFTAGIAMLGMVRRIRR